MAHVKAAGTAKNLRDSKPKMLGVKVYGNQHVKKGGIIAGHDTYCDPNNVSYEFFDVEGALEEFFTEEQQEQIHMTNEYAYKTWVYIKPE